MAEDGSASSGASIGLATLLDGVAGGCSHLSAAACAVKLGKRPHKRLPFLRFLVAPFGARGPGLALGSRPHTEQPGGHFEVY